MTVGFTLLRRTRCRRTHERNGTRLVAPGDPPLLYPPLFATLSGAHLYGFPSPDSDFDLRGVYVLPLTLVIGLDRPKETVTRTFQQAGRQIDLVAHDIKKFLTLLLNKNGYALEQLYSPLVVQGGAAF